MLKKGDQVKPFEINDMNGDHLSTSDFPGDYLLISFMRGADCPFCNLRLMELENHQSRMSEMGIVNYLIYHATAKQLEKNMNRMSPAAVCKLIPDPDLALHQMYDIKKSYYGTLLTFLKIGKIIETIRKRVFTLSPIGDPPLIPADFLVDKDGKVLISHYGKDYTDNVYMEDVFQLVEENGTPREAFEEV